MSSLSGFSSGWLEKIVYWIYLFFIIINQSYAKFTINFCLLRLLLSGKYPKKLLYHQKERVNAIFTYRSPCFAHFSSSLFLLDPPFLGCKIDGEKTEPFVSVVLRFKPCYTAYQSPLTSCTTRTQVVLCYCAINH